FDRLLAELGQEGDVQQEAAKAAADELKGDEATAGDPTEAASEEVEATPAPAEVTEKVVEKTVEVSASRISLPVVEGTGDLQVAFPAEVLAAALRPMVKDWVEENLSQIVEKLVREEISKLSED